MLSQNDASDTATDPDNVRPCPQRARFQARPSMKRRVSPGPTCLDGLRA
jgi:hypothetical protein